MKDNANDFLKNLLGFSIGPVAGAFIGFITVPVTTWLIIPEEFGKAAMFTLAYSMVTMFLYLGLDVAFTREYNAREDKGNLFWNSLSIPLIFSFVCSCILIFNGEIVSKLLFDSYQAIAIKALAVSLPFAVASRFNLVVIRMQERGTLYSLLSILHQLSNFIFTIVLLLSFERSFEYIVIAQVASNIVQSFVSGYFVMDYWFASKRIDWAVLKIMLIFGLPFVPTSLIEWVYNGFDKMALRNWSDFNQIGLYSAGFKIVAILSIAQTAFGAFWIPVVYRWHESGESKQKFQLVTDGVTVSFFVLAVFIILFRHLILNILSAEYANAATIIPFLLFVPIFEIIKSTTVVGILLSRKTYFIFFIIMVSTVINIIGNWILVPQYGALGAAIATAVSVNCTFWLHTIISRKLWRIKLSFYKIVVNNILFVILAFVSLLNCLFLEVMLVMIIITVNYKIIMYLMAKFRTTTIFHKYLLGIKEIKRCRI